MRHLYCYNILNSLTACAFRKTNLDIMFYQCPCRFIMRHRDANHAENRNAADMTITPLLPAVH